MIELTDKDRKLLGDLLRKVKFITSCTSTFTTVGTQGISLTVVLDKEDAKHILDFISEKRKAKNENIVAK